LASEVTFPVLIRSHATLLIGSLLSKKAESDQWNNSSLIQALQFNLSDSDSEIQESAITAVGKFGSSTTGLRQLNSNQDLLARYREYSTQSNLSLCFCNSVSSIVSLRDEATSELVEKTFKFVWKSESTIDIVTKLENWILRSFPTQRHVIFDLYHRLTFHYWGLFSLLSAPRIFHWLVARNIHQQSWLPPLLVFLLSFECSQWETIQTGTTTEDEWRWKYEIVKSIVTSIWGREVCEKIEGIGDAGFQRMTKYLNDGIFYQPAAAAVLIEDQSSMW